MSRYRIAFSVEILVNTIWFTLLGTATVLFGIYKVPRYSWILSVPVLIFGLVLLAGAVLYLFPRRVTISDSQLIVDYGLHSLHKRYNLQSILEVRFAERADEDDVKRGQPTNGVLDDTVVICFQDQDTLYLSLSDSHGFYREIEAKIGRINASKELF